MNNKLFDFRTTVTAHIQRISTEEILLQSVVINAPHAVRSRIWDIIVKDYFNPGVAKFGIFGDTPTTIKLLPYPGYENSDLVAQMAFAAAQFALIEDFTVLFSKPAYHYLDDKIAPWPKGFAIDPLIIDDFQRLYVDYMAAKDLQNRVRELHGINYYAVKEWYSEAVEAFRRLQFADINPGDEKTRSAQLDLATGNLTRIERIESKARAIHETQASIRRQLEAAIADFTAATKTPGLTTKQVYDSYHQISFGLKMEQTRLDTDVDAFTQDWTTLQVSMDSLRKVTPPAPPVPKK